MMTCPVDEMNRPMGRIGDLDRAEDVGSVLALWASLAIFGEGTRQRRFHRPGTLASGTARTPAVRRRPRTDARAEHRIDEGAGNPLPLRQPGHRQALPDHQPTHRLTRLPRPPAARETHGTAGGHIGGCTPDSGANVKLGYASGRGTCGPDPGR